MISISLIVVIKDKNRFVLGSDKQASFCNNKSHDATKIWDIPELPGAIFGAVGEVRPAQVIQYNQIINLNDLLGQSIDTGFVINQIVPNIISCLKVNGINCVVNTEKDISRTILPCSFVFAIEDHCWTIESDLSVSEVSDYTVLGSGMDVANGALYATKDKNPFERIVTSIHAAAETTLFVDDEIDMLATEYFKEDRLLIARALGLEKEYNKMIARENKEKTAAKTKKSSSVIK